MCGFAGRFLHRRGDPGAAERALAVLKRRGPDGQRIWRSEDGRVELVHARLAIVDSDPQALQPFVSADGARVLAFNGEIYNYAALRTRYRERDWRTRSDTEVLEAGWQREGASVFDHARGMYAGALWDRDSHALILFRDPVGKKPLFLGRSETAIAFGSSVLAVRELLESHRSAVDPRGVEDLFAQGFVEPPRSLVPGIEQIEPGSLIRIALSDGSMTRAAITTAPVEFDPTLSFAEHAQEVGRRLRAATELRLENNPRPAVLLSGGIDSTVVTRSALEICRERGLQLKAYSLKPLLPGTQDGPYAAAAAKRLGIDLQWVRPPLRRLGERVLAALDDLDEPLAMPSYFALHSLVAEVRQHARVLLSGDGGDEAFLGYGTPQDWLIKPDAKPPGVRCGPPLPEWMGGWARRTVSATMLGHMHAKADRASAEQGVELRSPLLDSALLAYARALPHEMLTHGGISKALLKAQLSDWPTAFLERPKLGFAFNLRWLWALSNFAGLREGINAEAHALAEPWLPTALRAPPAHWRSATLLQHFSPAWTLLSLSRFVAKR